jgi:hypothetical protein
MALQRVGQLRHLAHQRHVLNALEDVSGIESDERPAENDGDVPKVDFRDTWALKRAPFIAGLLSALNMTGDYPAIDSKSSTGEGAIAQSGVNHNSLQ